MKTKKSSAKVQKHDDCYCDSSSMWGCCTHPTVALHAVAGVGGGLLLAYYFDLPNAMMIGWVLVIIGIAGHFMRKR